MAEESDPVTLPILTAAWTILGVERGMMLFSEATTNQEVAVGASLVACLLAAISGLFAYLTSRDKLRFDVEKAEMRAELKSLKAATEECDRHRADDKVTIDRLREQNQSQQRQLDKNRELIDALKKQVDAIPGSKHD